MKRSRECGSRASVSRRCSFSGSDRTLPPRMSLSQRPRYSTRSQVSMRLAVAVSDSPESSARPSEQSGLAVAANRYASDHAEELAGLHGVAGRDREPAHRPVAVRADLVLHLHRLDHAEDDGPPSTSSPSATSTARTVPCIGLTTASVPRCRSRARLAVAAAPGELGVRRLGLDQGHVEAAALDLDADRASSLAAGGDRAGHGRERARPPAPPARAIRRRRGRSPRR